MYQYSTWLNEDDKKLSKATRDKIIKAQNAYRNAPNDAAAQQAHNNAYMARLNDKNGYASDESGRKIDTDAPVNTYASGGTYKVQADGTAPKGLTVGSTVVTAGGTYKINSVNADGTYNSSLVSAKQNTASYNNIYANDDGSGYYRDALDQRNTAANATANAAVNSIKNSKTVTNAKYDDLAKQAYVSYLQNKQALPDQMAKMGLDGQGAAESSAVNMNNAYGRQVFDNEQSRASAMRDYDKEIANAYLSADNAKAQAQADYDNYMASLSFNDKWNTQNYNLDRDKFNASTDQWNKEFGLDYNNEMRDRAKYALDLGYTNEQLADVLGIPLADAQKLAKELKKTTE